ncbi:hypothetical protein SAMD00019534_024480 [Acytostelium subglobosum LB1]|uniref:hypothetical protein n=1 Tax=Acytostelium subglobosum LB1 TaxID=1410327 RepID=UPI0006451F91|nr:hypothetical protein SAMD00019534_024480 [Acytostelium subglobosum LB1]GAM19273.1 hypothetical protein SAMD00019534_024480 [Acytostelium subglobosum LB1]|eukprot:XP_012757200.1 hypothetical protein SAMD00019534_024480 [Acytostelium subglobosum LB1]
MTDIHDDIPTGGATPTFTSQSSNEILMVQPTHFELNAQAANDNYFMNAPKDPSVVHQQALEEFHTYHDALKEKGVKVTLFQPNDGLETPDCLFPNNWFSTHQPTESRTGQEHVMVLYPMCHPNRRLERRDSIIKHVLARRENTKLIDLSSSEQTNIFLEGTGSFVIDRVNKVAYVCVSQRSHRDLALEWAEFMGYKLAAFTSTDSAGKIIYHTNVMMAICSSIAIVCLETVEDPVEKKELLDLLSKNHTVLQITRAQVEQFCGNVIEVRGSDDKKYLVASKTAYDAFTEAQRSQILNHVDDFITRDIPTIQTVGGGGIRCMIAELF